MTGSHRARAADTISIGLAAAVPGEALDTALQRADAAAKREGAIECAAWCEVARSNADWSG